MNICAIVLHTFRVKKTLRCVHAILEAGFRVIVVDTTNDYDGPGTVVKAPRAGQSEARNLALRHVLASEHVLFCDQDVVPKKNVIENLLNVINKTSDAAIVAPIFHNEGRVQDPPMQIEKEVIPRGKNLIEVTVKRLAPIIYPGVNVDKLPLTNKYFPADAVGFGMTLVRNTVAHFMTFDPELDLLAEDYDVCLSLSKYKTYFILDTIEHQPERTDPDPDLRYLAIRHNVSKIRSAQARLAAKHGIMMISRTFPQREVIDPAYELNAPISIDVEGITFLDPTGEYATAIRYQGTYEPNLEKLIKSLPDIKDLTFIDVGGHAGWFALLSKKLGFDSYLGIEMSQRYFPFLATNTYRAWEPEKAKIMMKAIGCGKPTVMYDYSINRECGRIDTIPLHSITPSEPYFLKIDIEGSESMVINPSPSLTEALKSCRAIAMETHGLGAADYPKICCYLKDIGFNVSILSNHRMEEDIRFIKPAEELEWKDLIIWATRS